jgi:putative solute:sodium symporter small subunit
MQSSSIESGFSAHARTKVRSMADADQEGWWRRTKALAVAALGGAVIVAFLLFVVSELLGPVEVFGFSIGYLLAAEAVPLILVAIVFWFADRQDETDRRHGMTED